MPKSSTSRPMLKAHRGMIICLDSLSKLSTNKPVPTTPRLYLFSLII